MSKNQQISEQNIDKHVTKHTKLTLVGRVGRIRGERLGFKVRHIIEFCQSNLTAGTQKVKEELEKDAELDVVEYGCLGHCGECYEYLFALVNGEIVTGESPEDLLQNIRQFLHDIDQE